MSEGSDQATATGLSSRGLNVQWATLLFGWVFAGMVAAFLLWLLYLELAVRQGWPTGTRAGRVTVNGKMISPAVMECHGLHYALVRDQTRLLEEPARILVLLGGALAGVLLHMGTRGLRDDR